MSSRHLVSHGDRLAGQYFFAVLRERHVSALLRERYVSGNFQHVSASIQRRTNVPKFGLPTPDPDLGSKKSDENSVISSTTHWWRERFHLRETYTGTVDLSRGAGKGQHRTVFWKFRLIIRI